MLNRLLTASARHRLFLSLEGSQGHLEMFSKRLAASRDPIFWQTRLIPVLLKDNQTRVIERTNNRPVNATQSRDYSWAGFSNRSSQ